MKPRLNFSTSSGPKLTLTLVFAFFAISLIAGCSTSVPDSAGTPEGSVSHVRPTMASEDPFGAYLGTELLSINSAMNDSQYKCYAENGYPKFLEVLPDQKADHFRSIADTPDFPTTFASFTDSPWFSNENVARGSGFGKTSSSTERSVVVMDKSFQSVIDDCRSSVLSALGADDKVLKQYVQLGNTLADSIVAAGASVQSTLESRVFRCLKDKGYSLDKNGANVNSIWGIDFGIPLGTVVSPPFPDLTKQGSVAIMPARAESYTPTAEESKMAVDMYKCSVETGAKAEWDRSIVDAKNNALASNETALTELNPAIRALAANVSATLAEK